MDKIQCPKFLEQVADAKILKTKKKKNFVYNLNNEIIVKVFYMSEFSKTEKRVQKFISKISLLKNINVNTLDIIRIENYPEYQAIAVFYKYIPGKTCREIFMENNDRSILFLLFKFLYSLQKTGIYFKDLHPGNVILNEKGEFYLIDVRSVIQFKKPIPFWASCNNLVTFFSNKTSYYYFSQKTIVRGINCFLNNALFSEEKKIKYKKHLFYLINLKRKNSSQTNTKFTKYFWIRFFIFRFILCELNLKKIYPN